MTDKSGESEYWEKIWRLVAGGDTEAYALFYNHFVDDLYRYGVRICPDAETLKDGIQEVFIDVYMKRESIRISPGNMKFYLLLALRRNLVKKIKAGKRFIHKNDDLPFESVFSIESQLINREIEMEVHSNIAIAIKNLPERQKEAIYLRFNECLGYDEIAILMDINVESVRKQVCRALKMVREVLVTDKPGKMTSPD